MTQRAFSSGIMGPLLKSRSDVDRWSRGIRRGDNLIVSKYGALISRGGLLHVTEVKDGSLDPVRSVPFIFDADDRFVLEMGDGYVRFAQNFAQVVVGSLDAWDAALVYLPGDLVERGGANYYAQETSYGFAPESNPDQWYPLEDDILEIPTPYSADELFDLHWHQDGDYVWFTHADHPPYELVRLDNLRWTLRPMPFLPPIRGPGQCAVSIESGGGGTYTRRWCYTAVRKGGLEESLVGHTATTLIGTTSGGSPAKITLNVANTLANGDDVIVTRVTPVTGVTDATLEQQLLGEFFNISGRTAFKFDLDGTDGIALTGLYELEVVPLKTPLIFGSLNGGNDENLRPNAPGHALLDNDVVLCLGVRNTLGGVLDPTLKKTVTFGSFAVKVIDANNFILLDTEGLVNTGGNDAVFAKTVTSITTSKLVGTVTNHTWHPVNDALEYRLYKDEGQGTFGFIGSSATTSFQDNDIEPDYESAPPLLRNPFRRAGDYPSTVGSFKGRLCFARSNNKPNGVELSRTDDLRNFTRRQPLRDDDAISFAVRSAQEITQLLEVKNLLVMASNGTWLASGDADGTLTAPDGPNLDQQEYSGASSLRAIPVGTSILYTQARGPAVLAADYTLQSDGIASRDVSTYVPHLLAGRRVRAWALQKQPHPVVWMVLSDGSLVTLTYDRVEQIIAWTTQSSGAGALFRDVCVIPEGDRDVPYFTVERTLGAGTSQFLEALADRPENPDLADLRSDYVCMDSAMSYDGSNTDELDSLTLFTAGDWLAGSTFDLFSGMMSFVPGDVGKGYRLVGEDGAEVEVTVLTYVAAGDVTVRAEQDVPASLQNVATSSWRKMVGTITGLDLFEGMEVAVLGDGVDEGPLTVAGGQITVAHLCGIVHVGLAFVPEFEDLDYDVDTPQGATTSRKKRVNRVFLEVNGSRGFEAACADSGRFYPQPIPDDLADDELFTGQSDIGVDGGYTTGARVIIRQRHPLPLTVLALEKSIEIQ